MADVLTRAFADNACYAWLFPRAARREGDLRRFFAAGLRARAAADLTWVVVDGQDRALGTATLEPPGGVAVTLPRQVFGWVVPTLLGPGPLALQRQFAASGYFARENQQTAGAAAYWHVYAVAVDPDHQGAGAGSALMRGVFEAAAPALSARSAPVILTTQRAKNLAFYERFGFEGRGRFVIGAGSPDAFLTWSMRRRDV